MSLTLSTRWWLSLYPHYNIVLGKSQRDSFDYLRQIKISPTVIGAVSSYPLWEIFRWVHVPSYFYARVILSERRQRVHTFTFLVSPSTIARTLWMFGFQVLFVRIWEWLTFMPLAVVLPHTSQRFAIISTSKHNLQHNICILSQMNILRQADIFILFSVQETARMNVF